MRVLPFTAALLVAATQMMAQEGTKWINLQGAAIRHDDGSGFKNGSAYGLGTGLWLSDRWGLELSGLETKLESKATGFKQDETHGFLSGLFNFNPGGETWVPYARFGAGMTGRKGGDRGNLHLGLGVQAFFAEHGMFFAEVREVHVGVRHTDHHELMGLLGLGVRWGGGRTPAPAPAPAPEPEAPAAAPEPKPVVEMAPPPPPAPAPEPPKPAVAVPAPPPPPPAKIILDEAVLHFANGKADLNPAGVEAIRKVAQSLKSYPGTYSLVVSGHTSSVGSVAFNKSLSRRRSEAVAKVLVAAGIPEASIQTVGEGPDKPLGENKTKAGQARNRRVEIDVKVAGGKPEMRKTEVTAQE